MLVCDALILDGGQTLRAWPENIEKEITRGDFVYLEQADKRPLAQVVSDTWWDEEAEPKDCARITERAPAEDMQRLGWDIAVPVRILYNAEFAYVRTRGMDIPAGAKVVVTTEHGNEIGLVLQKPQALRNGEKKEGEIPLVRIAGADDLALAKRNAEQSENAWNICREKIDKHRLPMNLVKVHILLEGNKILFFFTSDGRVDFRALAKDLAGIFHTRIELRQIGVRDRSQLLGGCGVCGMILCCHSCKAMVQSVSIKMAKKQNLALNSSKISGVCGKLLCCLSYEYDTCEDSCRCQQQAAADETQPQ